MTSEERSELINLVLKTQTELNEIADYVLHHFSDEEQDEVPTTQQEI